VKLTSAQLSQLEATDLANIIRKLAAGKSLTRREAEILERQKNSEEANFVHTWDDLAAVLGRTRRTIQNWRDRFGKKCPKDRADGRKDVKAWRKFMLDHKLVDEPDLPEDGEPNKSHWDRERARVDFQAALFRLQTERNKYVELDEICAAVGQMLAGFRTAINMLPGSAARWLIGLKDFQQIKQRLETEVDGVLRSLGRCKHLDELAPAVVAKLYPDESPEFRQKLCKSVDQVLVETGREALADLLHREFAECPLPAA
jgi:hypothetical protein